MDDLVNRMQSLQIKTCYFCNQPGHLAKDCAELVKIKQDPNFINYLNLQKKLNDGRRQTSHNQIATSPVITVATWNNNYDAIIAAAKRNRDEKYASLPKAKRNFKNNNNIKINNNGYNNNINENNNNDLSINNNVNNNISYNLRNRKILKPNLNNNIKNYINNKGSNNNIENNSKNNNTNENLINNNSSNYIINNDTPN